MHRYSGILKIVHAVKIIQIWVFKLYQVLNTWEYKGCPHKFGNFFDPPPPAQACPHLVDYLPPPSLCPCRHKASIIWNITTCEQFTLKGKKKLVILILDVHTCVFLLENFHSIIPKDGATLDSIHSLMNTSRMKILYTDILPN